MNEEDRFYALLGKRIKDRRDELGFSQDHVATLIDLSRPSLVNIEKGRQRLSAFQWVRLADALRTDVGTLMPDEDDDAKYLHQSLHGHRPEVVDWVTQAVARGTEEGQ